MEIKRDYYLDKLIRKKDNGLIKIITGIRSSRKSYLLNNLFYNHLLENGVDNKHIIKFAFDSGRDLLKIGEDLMDLDVLSGERLVDPKKFLDYIMSKTNDREKFYILLDEVQLLKSFEQVLNGFLCQDNFDVYVTGSNSKFYKGMLSLNLLVDVMKYMLYHSSFLNFLRLVMGTKKMLLLSIRLTEGYQLEP